MAEDSARAKRWSISPRRGPPIILPYGVPIALTDDLALAEIGGQGALVRGKGACQPCFERPSCFGFRLRLTPQFLSEGLLDGTHPLSNPLPGAVPDSEGN